MGAEGLTPLMAEYQNRRPHPKSETTTPTHITAWVHGNWLATSPVHVSRCLGLVMLETSSPRYRHIPSANEDWESSLVEDWVERRWSRLAWCRLAFIDVAPPLKNPLLHERKEPWRRSRRDRSPHTAAFIDREKTNSFRFKAPTLAERPRCG